MGKQSHHIITNEIMFCLGGISDMIFINTRGSKTTRKGTRFKKKMPFDGRSDIFRSFAVIGIDITT